MSSRTSPQTPAPEETPVPAIEAAIADMLMAPTTQLGAARKRLLKHPPDDVTRALITALDRQADWREYGRIASALAACGTSEAYAALENRALGDHGHPRLIVRALERVPTPQAVETLLRLLATAKLRTRRSAAMALARRQLSIAIHPICVAAMQRGSTADRWMVGALRRMGDPAKLVRRLLEVPNISPAEHIAAIDALAAVPDIGRRLAAQRVLDRLASERSSLGRVAGDVAKVYRDRATLLRPAERVADTTLLRPVGSPQPGRSDLLVRPSSMVDEPERPATGIRALWERLRDALQAD